MWKIQFYFYQINGAFSKYHSTHSVIKVLINQKQKKNSRRVLSFSLKNQVLFTKWMALSSYQAIGHVIYAFINQKSQNFKQKKAYHSF